MGQQQLLLLVLGIVIVGIAVVAGIQAFSEGKSKADRDAATSDAMRVISDAQAWKLKPAAFGGGSGVSGFTGITFDKLGLPNSGNAYRTSSACMTLAAGTNAVLTVGKPAATGSCGATIATVTVAGTTQNDITWSYSAVGTN